MNVVRNKVQLIGRIVKGQDSFVFKAGKMKVNFPIDTNESFKSSCGDKEGKTRYSSEIVIRAMLMLERKQEPA